MRQIEDDHLTGEMPSPKGAVRELLRGVGRRAMALIGMKPPLYDPEDDRPLGYSILTSAYPTGCLHYDLTPGRIIAATRGLGSLNTTAEEIQAINPGGENAPLPEDFSAAETEIK